jgi:hypothetical protein
MPAAPNPVAAAPPIAAAIRTIAELVMLLDNLPVLIDPVILMVEPDPFGDCGLHQLRPLIIAQFCPVVPVRIDIIWINTPRLQQLGIPWLLPHRCGRLHGLLIVADTCRIGIRCHKITSGTPTRTAMWPTECSY